MSEISGNTVGGEPGKDQAMMPKIIYALYLVSPIVGLTGLIGVIVAYVYRGDGSGWLRSHYDFQIRTFWIGLLYVIVGILLTFVVVGYLVLLFWFVWLVIRCVKGWKALSEGQAVANPERWSW
ncbi:DUF4870 family protein [Ectothiorhodospira lacustris]|uniref:DUF4870 family protein n=1 Tax=Ectothiorhodospira lacustris TaxID=2899127 RepID=UPI001EE89DF6|nr:hypothetical protein [Ectothiorhodospira lacustris]MCG5500231.1 hypothetical protein [Ectothiorhodospira lacustris]MCG5510279.1 hypothetical protein [Ectothiorhodospira lacustris]MCG5521854.1 hypothetical protein [Ectothiorhodospira lacustris]